jgi:hypothetical protein
LEQDLQNNKRRLSAAVGSPDNEVCCRRRLNQGASIWFLSFSHMRLMSMVTPKGRQDFDDEQNVVG